MGLDLCAHVKRRLPAVGAKIRDIHPSFVEAIEKRNMKSRRELKGSVDQIDHRADLSPISGVDLRSRT